ncbi:hypothetical protein [Sulfurimonas sp.]|uniref:hypothetical protein n=1 Tax=Sulfurimonas sp. TaxID=2022749 RepID=UPI003D0F1C38
MKQQEMCELLGVPERTLREWKHNNRNNVYRLLESLSSEDVERLLDRDGYLKVLENEKYFKSLRDFEKYLYPLLSKNDTEVWLHLAKDKSLSTTARMRSAYLYTFLTGKKIRLSDKPENRVAFYHANRPQSDDRTVKYYHLKNGINEMRYNQYKTTGAF